MFSRAARCPNLLQWAVEFVSPKLSPERAAFAGSDLRVNIFLAILLGAAATSGHAQVARREVQAWGQVTFTLPVAPSTDLSIDALTSVGEDVSAVTRELVRGILRHRLSERLSVGAGYVWTRIDGSSITGETEHRAVVEVRYRLPLDSTGMTVSTRTQLEERFRNNADRASLRLRHLTRVDVPLGGDRTALVAWNEYFHELHRTSWAGAPGPSLMLNFVGVHLPLNDHMAIEPGYLNQTNFVAGQNQVRHIAALFVAIRP